MSVRAIDTGGEFDREPRYIRVGDTDLPLPRDLAGGDTRAVGFDLNEDELLEFTSIAPGGVVTDLFILTRQQNGRYAIVRLEVKQESLDIADANADLETYEEAKRIIKCLEAYITRFREIEQRLRHA